MPGKKTTTAAKDAFKVIKKRSGRWSVLGKNGKYINGAEKVAILENKGLVKVLKKKAEAPAEA